MSDSFGLKSLKYLHLLLSQGHMLKQKMIKIFAKVHVVGTGSLGNIYLLLSTSFLFPFFLFVFFESLYFIVYPEFYDKLSLHRFEVFS